jgi:pimeloyl-ACP methyl ester carboxylesterase
VQKTVYRLIGTGINWLAELAPAQAGRLGFRLFCQPGRTKLGPRQLQFLNSAAKFSLTCGNHKIQGYKWGTGACKIVFIHGWQSHTCHWKKYIEALDKTKYTAYAIDAPAHGLSSGNTMTVPLYSEAICALLNHIQGTDIVVAHSIGAFTAIYTFFEQPQLSPCKLIVMASPGNATEFIHYFKTLLGLSAKAVALTLKHFEKAVGKKETYFSAPDFVANLKSDGLIIHDMDDQYTPVQNAREIYQAWKKAQLIIINGTGHQLRSLDVLRHVIHFIERSDPVQVRRCGGDALESEKPNACRNFT